LVAFVEVAKPAPFTKKAKGAAPDFWGFAAMQESQILKLHTGIPREMRARDILDLMN
jgi:hypothetical protein